MKKSLPSIFLDQFKSPLIYLLLLAALVNFILFKPTDASVILFVVIFNSIFGTIQEYKASRAIDALKKLVPKIVKLIDKDGKERLVDITKIKKGDLILVETGDVIGCDAIVKNSYSLKINEASLTGESIAVEKKGKDKIFAGTSVVFGRAYAIVDVVGEETEYGKLAKFVQSSEEVESPIQKKLSQLAGQIGIAVLVVSFFIVFIGLLSGLEFSDLFLTATALAVSAIPEGLPVVVTVVFAVGLLRMAKRNAIIKRLSSVESLGSTTVICADKTGTLTEGKMAVTKVYFDKKIVDVLGNFDDQQAFFKHADNDLDALTKEKLTRVLKAVAICNDSRILTEENKLDFIGDPTEAALKIGFLKLNLNTDLETEFPRIAEFPFDQKTRLMATVNRVDDSKRLVIFVKGSWESVISMSQDFEDKEEVLRMADKLAKQGLRVIASAELELDDKNKLPNLKDLEGKLEFLGLVGILDPVRKEAPQVLESIKRANVKFVMITGDHMATAQTIAKQAGMDLSGKSLTGHEIDKLTDVELLEIAPKINLVARARPKHKLRLINAYRKLGEVVAMTGDGVNDGPALVAADIGIAMGRTGTDVAKEASDMIIADDNLKSIVSAIEEGRVIFENLRKVILYLLSTGLGEVLVILISIILSLPLPLVAVQIIWLNLVTDGFTTVALAMEPKEDGVLKREPFGRRNLLSETMIYRLFLIGTIMALGTIIYYQYLIGIGDDLTHARTFVLTVLAIFQWLNVINARSSIRSIFTINPFSNRYIILSLLIVFALQIAAVYLPFFQNLLHTTALSLTDWMIAFLLATSVIFVDEVRKLLRKVFSLRGTSNYRIV